MFRFPLTSYIPVDSFADSVCEKLDQALTFATEEMGVGFSDSIVCDAPFGTIQTSTRNVDVLQSEDGTVRILIALFNDVGDHFADLLVAQSSIPVIGDALAPWPSFGGPLPAIA
tara:strand:+ start:3208 stop:3549 length:342 start_codon:yes stop_codon:yes gene_type:complete